MNNKGFTLVELLAVIIIISLLALLANTSVTKVVRDSKSELYASQIQMIKLAAESWGSENIDKLPDSGQCKYLTLGDLKNYGLLDSSVKNPKTDKEFSNNLNIKITATENKFGKTNISYEVDSNDISECEIALEKTLDRVCKYDKTSTVPEKTAGAKYSCEVKSGTSYNFYVLTTPQEGETTINLIMDRNICEDGTPTEEGKMCFVSWNLNNSVTSGPVTAVEYLNNATSTWLNIDNLNLIYNDEGKNFTSFELKGKARLPYLNEVGMSDGTNNYLYENLDGSMWMGVGDKPKQIISGIEGYWVLSTYEGKIDVVWTIGYVGRFGAVAPNNDKSGVRSVITLKM